MKKDQAREMAKTCPYDFEWREALITLYSLQQFEAACKSGKTYSHGIFYNQIFHVLSGIRNSASRTTVIGMLEDAKCFVCGDSIGGLKNKKLDHLIPLHLGGRDNLENTSVLCGPHNSSKGKKDLIEWWMWKEWGPSDLPRTVLVLYARLMWEAVERIRDDMPDYMRLFIEGRASALPTPDHIVSLYGSTYAAMGLLGWERMHENS